MSVNLKQNLAIPKSRIKKKIIHYRKKLDLSDKPFEQILRKLVILYFLQLKILLLEYNKNKKIGYEYAMYKKDSRERQMIIFLHNFKGFLSEFGRQPYFNSRAYSSYEELSEYLDNIYDAEINYYNILSKHGLSTLELIQIYAMYPRDKKGCLSKVKKNNEADWKYNQVNSETQW